ncbi:MAG: insulinase family protein [Novosphingobium sp.]|nr:insulinase family protein [Novosphingobium sp.]
MRRYLLATLSAVALSACAAQPAREVASAPAPAAPVEAQAAPLADLVKAVDIPYESFTLANGLRVLVHTDRKAPVVALSVWYDVGSKHEPKGKTGFAHLFEHLMFNGSENVPGDFFEPLQQVGATDVNGTTWFDRTNYFETVPTGALDLALMMESDRMGHLLGAVTQEKLDNQRGVVQNEKRQGDNQPYGLVEYEQLENLYPGGHPYHHSTIGSMADLNSASLADVRTWFRDHYGPNNAILVLAGDIDTATAREKVNKWFGAIPSGPAVQPVAAAVPTLAAVKDKTIQDQVATTRIYRMWAVPGLDNPDNLPLAMSGLVLGGLASSRLDDELVRKRQVAVSVSAGAEIFAQAGQFVISADVKPGVDPVEAAAALDGTIADFIANGPDASELARAATVYAGAEIRGLEKVGGFAGKAPTLAQGLLYSNDPEYFRKSLDRAAALTPQEVRDVTAKWLSRPVFRLVVAPGTRTEGGEHRGGWFRGSGDGKVSRPAFWRDPALGTGGPSPAVTAPDRTALPDVGELAPLDFPDVERAQLANGIKVYFARRTSVPLVAVRVSFDAGYAADPRGAPGTEAMMLKLMDEGTQSLNSTELARAKERLGARLSGGATLDATFFQLDALKPNLAPSLELLADYVKRPAFDPAELERVRAQQLTAISAEMTNPGVLAQRLLSPVLYGDAYPYGIPGTGTGDPAVVQKLTRDDLSAFHNAWIRPDKAAIFVVGDTTLADVLPLLAKSFGQWQAPATPAPAKDFSATIPAPRPRILLVDRPNAPQSFIVGGQVLASKGTDDLLDLKSANEVLGSNFLSRLNMDLRETKGWSYGVRSTVRDPLERAAFTVTAPVQADRTGDSIAALRQNIRAFLGTEGVTPEELRWSTNGSARELPGSFETNADVLGGMVRNVLYGRPDTYYETLAARYHAMTRGELDKAARAAIDPAKLTWLVVGDRKTVEPQLKKLGLPVEIVPLPTGGN